MGVNLFDGPEFDRASTQTDTLDGAQLLDDDIPPPPEPLDADDPARDNPPDDEHRTWQPVDLTAVLDGTWQPPQPTVGARDDGVGLFYPGKKHTISSESEAGKTWLALAAERDEILAGHHVVYVDFEDDEATIVGRLTELGLDSERIQQFFHYIRPESPIFLAPNGSDVVAVLEAYKPSLAIVDGVTEAMTLHNLNPLDNADCAKFGRMLPSVLAKSGAAVVSLDHVTKNSEGRGKYSIGAVHKLNGLNGAAYSLDNRRPFGVGIKGVTTVRIAKDRHGQLRKHALPGGGGMWWFADLVVDSTIEGQADGVVTVATPHERDPDARPTILMKRISDELAKHGDGLSQRTICTAVTGKTDTLRAALDYLIADGYVTVKTPHKLIQPYSEGDENQ